MWSISRTHLQQRGFRASILLGVFTFLLAADALSQLACTDRWGRIQSLLVREEYMPVRTEFRLPTLKWKQLPGLGSVKKFQYSETPDGRVWWGSFEVEKGKRCRYRQKLTETRNSVTIDLSVTAETDLSIEGVYFWFDVPIPLFAGGQCELSSPFLPQVIAELPGKQPSARHLTTGHARRFQFRDARRESRVEVRFNHTCFATVQDNREYNDNTYSVIVEAYKGTLKKGWSVSIQATIYPGGQADRRPVQLTVTPDTRRYGFDGFGGNYCFQTQSAVTRYTLDNLAMSWTRTRMTLMDWEPENDNESAERVNWNYFKKQDEAGSDLRHEFELAQTLQKKGVRHIISVWRLPPWLYANPSRDIQSHRRRIDPAKWPELLECIGSYLLHAKKTYGIEPDLFSFNEGDIGVYILFSPEEHRDAIKRIGKHLKNLGLKTRMLLGDVSLPRSSHMYVIPAVADPEAIPYVGGLSFHSWHGASPDQYAAWGSLAETLKIPLLVGEVGVDPNAYKTASFRGTDYALQEAAMFQEILLYARAQSLLQWEFSADYSMIKEIWTPSSDQPRLLPTTRFWFMKHFCDLTPQASHALKTSSSHAKVLVTAFADRSPSRKILTVHILNRAAARQATLSGMARFPGNLRMFTTSSRKAFVESSPPQVKDDTLELSLPARSLVTLTTMAPRNPPAAGE